MQMITFSKRDPVRYVLMVLVIFIADIINTYLNPKRMERRGFCPAIVLTLFSSLGFMIT